MISVEGLKATLGFNDPEDGRTYEVPFRLTDGAAYRADIEGGYVIPEKILKQLKGTAAILPNPERGKPNASDSSAVKPGGSKPTGRSNNMAAATASKPKVTPKVAAPKVAANGKVSGSNGTAKAATTKATTAPAANPTTKATAKPKATPKAAPAVEPQEKAQAAPKPKATPKEQTAPAADPNRELSPMELSVRKSVVAEGEVQINIAPMMYRQIVWNEIRPYPEGRSVPGWKAFKKAFDNAAERSYVFINVNEAAAKFLVTKVFVAGFETNWVGSLAGGFRRAAKRVARELAERFGFEVPKIIAEHVVEGVKNPGAGPGRPKGSGKKVTEAVETPPAAPKAKVTPKATAATPKATTAKPKAQAATPPVAVKPKVTPKPVVKPKPKVKA